MGQALVEMLRYMAGKGILGMRDDREFRSGGLCVSWLGMAVAAEVASLAGGAVAAAEGGKQPSERSKKISE